MTSAFPLLCWIVLAAFLGCLGMLGLAVTKTAAPDGAGHRRGCLGGCGAALALFFLCGLGIAGLGAAVTAAFVGTAVEKNPIRRIEIRRSGERAAPAPRSAGAADEAPATRPAGDGPVHALFTVRGDAGQELVELMQGLVEVDLSRLDDVLTIQHRTAPDGTPFDIYEFRLPLTERDLERFQSDVERELNGLKLHLPESVEIEFQGAEDLEPR